MAAAPVAAAACVGVIDPLKTPESRYVRTPDGVFIAFQVFGRGGHDLLFVPGFFSNLIMNWEIPGMARILERFADFARVIVIDRRGVGLSDRVSPLPPLEVQMDDLRAVLDAVQVSRAHLVGYEDGADLCALFAASYPERSSSLSAYHLVPRPSRAEGYPFGRTPEAAAAARAERGALWARGWGREAAQEDYEWAAPSLANDEEQVALFARYLALAASPGAALAVIDRWAESDIRAVLPSIRVPTLILARTEMPMDYLGLAEWVAAQIPDARLAVLPGKDLAIWVEADPMIDEIEAFITGVRPLAEPQTILATVLFTDIVGSTEKQASLGDRGWKDLIQRHHALVRNELGRHRGVEHDTAGDGFYATFDGPARAVRCALAIVQGVRELGIEIRAGLHTGECQLIDGKAGGIAVSIGARVAALAATSQVLVSSTVKDLVAGSGLRFEDRGVHELKGVPDAWHLYAAIADSGDEILTGH